MSRARRWAVALALLAFTAPARAEDLPDAPADVPDDADVTFERADTLDAETVEVEMGLRGSGRAAARRDRTLRLRGDELDATVREGAGDPLAGAELGTPGGWRVGKVAPQWGRGWLVGAPASPWSAGSVTLDGLRAGPRGDVAQLAVGDGLRLEGLVGRFAKRDVAALRAGAGGAGVTLAGNRHGLAAIGADVGTELESAELVFDRRGRWRGEVALERPALDGRVMLFARSGSRGLRALLAPARSGPSQALGAGWDRLDGRVRPRARAALWRFGTGFEGARGALEVDLRLDQHAALTLGFEEQRGVRRESTNPGMRQGWWGVWRGGAEPVALELRIENWGRAAFGRTPVRSVTGAALEVRTPLGSRLRLEHRVFRSGPGESLRLPEVEADRLVLRALSGDGEHSQIDMSLPAPAGRMRAGLSWTASAKKPARTQWTLRWSRRARIGRAPT